ncbi:hypothetical protein FG91_01636 [Sphingopyxis sp. LC81]|uniref:DUF6118 family protein n=1 Tax=Sphingopyxis sp. LC81 TaxID=1502850 RepID=UPI0005106887|nr:DUF6118 family protein [Sphingopyxis sp. LC81]KGB55007.1 hypothetical protein FG91_01636 [Sphingopyxis sp. LC81]
MDERRLPLPLPYEPPEPDPATRAFNRLEGEMALMRRAVEHMAAEKAEIDVPDYGSTLSEIAKRLVSIERKPAMQMTPEDMGARTAAAAAVARREDKAAIAEAKQQHGEAARALRALLGTAATINEQRRHLRWAAGGGLLAGVLLWSVLPGAIVRSLPQSWHLPEKMAAHVVGAPSLWEGGVRLMRADSPEAFQAISAAADMRRDNREKIAACEKAALSAKKQVRCTIRIGHPQI